MGGSCTELPHQSTLWKIAIASTINDTEKKISPYLKKHEQWRDFLEPAREVLPGTEMDETVKWGMPTYTLNGKNIIGLTGFKNHCAIWFHNGLFLKDKDRHLVNAGEGTTKAQRQWRFEAGDRFPKRLVKSYVLEAINNARSGKTIKPEKKALLIPGELQLALDRNKRLQKAFAALTTGRQKEYRAYRVSQAGEDPSVPPGEGRPADIAGAGSLRQIQELLARLVFGRVHLARFVPVQFRLADNSIPGAFWQGV